MSRTRMSWTTKRILAECFLTYVLVVVWRYQHGYEGIMYTLIQLLIYLILVMPITRWRAITDVRDHIVADPEGWFRD